MDPKLNFAFTSARTKNGQGAKTKMCISITTLNPSLFEFLTEHYRHTFSSSSLGSWLFFGPWPGSASSTDSPNLPPPAHNQHLDEEDVNMGEAQPGTPNQPGLEQEEEQGIEQQ